MVHRSVLELARVLNSGLAMASVLVSMLELMSASASDLDCWME
jgi:hypothetical protein